MTPQELKNSILQRAIEGKLVEQRPEEGSVKQLIINSSINIRENSEFLFDIPESWEWINLTELCNLIGGYAFKSSKYISDGVRIIRISDFNENGLIDTDKKFYKEEELLNKYLIKSNDILMCMTGGTVGKTVFLGEINEKLYLNQRVAAIRVENKTIIDIDYLYYVISSKFIKNIINTQKNSTNDNISMKLIQEFPIPLPPLEEQERIVQRLEELMPLVEAYEESWQRLEDLNKKFPEDMKKSLLQEAIKGKLVDQRPEEGTGEDLYKEIQTEKKRKGISEILEDEMLFDIPRTWSWVRIGDICNIINGFTPRRTNPEFWDGDIPWFTIEDVREQGRFINYTNQHITEKALSYKTDRIIPPDTVLLCCTASIGEYAYTNIPLTTNQQFNGLVVKENYKKFVSTMYLYIYAQTLEGRLISNAGKTTFNYLSVGKLKEFVVPLPPLGEQKRIVAKIEELLPLCDQLMAQAE